ncbi:hypothetical protein X975_17104, partial [Stegodyphus mimosarum]
MSEFTLYRLCLWKTAFLLKNSYWNETHDNNTGGNPFSALPSSVVEDLITCVLELTTSCCLKVTDLYHLLTSGRVKHFKLEDILLHTEEFIAILMSLSVACQNLCSLTLKEVYCSDAQPVSGALRKSAALECVLSISPRLESIESCIEFDLKAIRNCEQLKILKLNFVPKCRLYDFLEEVNGYFWPNTSLTVLDVYEHVRHPVSYLEIAVILKNCHELTKIYNDVGASLEYLHSAELYDDAISTRYKLEKCYLGSAFLAPSFASASITAVRIATITCPLLKDVGVLVSDHEVIYALSDFQNLKSILLQWEPTDGGDFQLGVQMLLEKIGANLKILTILNFYNVDFAAIASFCPELEDFKIEYQTEVCYYDPPSTCFQHLKSLYIENTDGEFCCRENTLIFLLSNCTNLSMLHLEYAENLTDNVLHKILDKNSLSTVKEATILKCKLSAEGVQNLILHLKILEYFHFGSSQITFEEAASIVHEINPNVIMRSHIDYEGA